MMHEEIKKYITEFSSRIGKEKHPLPAVPGESDPIGYHNTVCCPVCGHDHSLGPEDEDIDLFIDGLLDVIREESPGRDI
jgi:hypothetical protein